MHHGDPQEVALRARLLADFLPILLSLFLMTIGVQGFQHLLTIIVSRT